MAEKTHVLYERWIFKEEKYDERPRTVYFLIFDGKVDPIENSSLRGLAKEVIKADLRIHRSDNITTLEKPTFRPELGCVDKKISAREITNFYQYYLEVLSNQ